MTQVLVICSSFLHLWISGDVDTNVVVEKLKTPDLPETTSGLAPCPGWDAWGFAYLGEVVEPWNPRALKLKCFESPETGFHGTRMDFVRFRI
jgi:hypothetical protein